MSIFDEPFGGWKDYEGVKKALASGKNVFITGIDNASKLHLSRVLTDGEGSLFFITHSEKRAREFSDDCYLFYGDYSYFPERDILFYKSNIGAGLISSGRMSVYKSLLAGDKRCFVTTFSALMNACVSPLEMKRRVLKLRRGDSLDLEALTKKLVDLGYEREYTVQLPGQFAVRGDIIDIYSVVEDNPYRLELWGDEVESIKSFDAESQRSIEECAFAEIFPATEDFEGVVKDSNVLDYLDFKNVTLVLDEPARLIESGRSLAEEISDAYIGRKERGLDSSELDMILEPEQIFAKLIMHGCMALSTVGMREKLYKADYTASISNHALPGYQNSFETLISDLEKYKKNKYKMIIVAPSRTRGKRLSKDISDMGIPAVFSENVKRSLVPGEVLICYGRLTRGFEYPQLRYVVISEGDIFLEHREKKKKENKKRAGGLKSMDELHIGDFVVHENHGIGIYRGIEKIERDRVIKDYMKIEYAGGSNLYILATQFDMLQKYSDASGKVLPKLSKLGTNEWTRTKQRVKQAVEVVAKDLVELYAKRMSTKGFIYDKDTAWQQEFEELFPYEETEDQLAAIRDVKNDMESGRVMDRLICGDVGFGKTEVAIRAAFKAVQNNKQVAYLVPTTILAKQHYDTFTQRFAGYPVRIELMCRLRTRTEQTKTAEALKNGEADIVIGTHRILSKDIAFHDLGLLIIDEEQRFGVRHKETIKKLKTNVNVMSLTATPIPRTLHMSLSGIRDLSLLSEPPIDRMPIQTYVMEYHDEMVREAVIRELSRDGQVYFVYNNINTIADMAIHISGLVPDAVVEYAHGRMDERALEDIMYRFVNGEIDVLVSTTIVETGLDIPNVNTIIISEAQNFGLSQLYQLRGRVGRSNRMAYAFLMYSRRKMISEVAEQRLDAIREFTELGSGIRIAKKDLEIRGAGNILGESQSGHMADVGYDLYCKYLNDAVKIAKGEDESVSFDTAVELVRDAYIPAAYIVAENEKLDMYRRIAALSDERERDDLVDELTDRYGSVPEQVSELLWIAMLKTKAHAAYITSVKEVKKVLTILIFPMAPVDPLRLTSMVRDYRGVVKFVTDAEKPRFVIDITHLSCASLPAFLDDFVERFGNCLQLDPGTGN